MRAISVRQPHAWAIIHGGKDVENRSQRAAFQFKPAIGERVLIHASKGSMLLRSRSWPASASGAPSVRGCSSAA